MPFQKIILRPGVDTTSTKMLNESSYSESQLVRFFQGKLQKIGGWQRIVSDPVVGIARGIEAWADLRGNPYVAVGTDQRLQVLVAGILYDITPIRLTHNVTPNYSTVISTKEVTIIDAANGAAAGDWEDITNPIAVGGIVLQGLYLITGIINANTYTINAATAALSTVNNGGVTAVFDSSLGSSTVTVTLPHHGLAVGSAYTVYVSTAVGGLTLLGDYIAVTVPTINTFTITASGVATSSDTQSENGGNSRIEYLLPSGLASAGSSSGGWGIGAWGFGPWGVGASGFIPEPLRQWSLDTFGQQLLASPSYGALYYWDPTLGTFENPAAVVSGSPAQQTGFFVAMPQRQVVSYGSTDPGTGQPDPMLIRWCDVEDYNDWTASSTNQAGSFRLSRGSKIVGGIQGPQYGLLWTDLSLWSMQYIQPPYIYGFNEIATGCGLDSMRAQCILGNNIFWRSSSSYFSYSGGNVQSMPCPVWDNIFKNFNDYQTDKSLLGANSNFDEFFDFYPSLTGDGEIDSYVKYNNADQVWDYGSLVRTCWTDQSVYGSPMGVNESGLIQQHEQGYNADGAPLISSATSGWFKVSDGTVFLFIDRMIPDFILTGGATITITIYMTDYPDDTPVVYGPYNVTSSTEYLIVRGRGRLAKMKISSTADLGTFWRTGENLFMATPAGKR